MSNYTRYILVLLTFLAACTQMPENAQTVNRIPDIFPDYVDVTIPTEIAPLNFYVNDTSECVYVKIIGKNGEAISISGDYADFDIDNWHNFITKNKGSALSVKVYTKSNNKWREYLPFNVYVSDCNLDEYGVTYRKIAPGYQTFSLIGVYQRNLSNFDEKPLLESRGVDGQCLNCHTPNRTNPDQFYVHIRGKHGATVIRSNGKTMIYSPKGENRNANLTYGSWHKDGRYCAFSETKIYQCFHTGKDKLVEPYDEISDIVVLDIVDNKIITSPLLQTDYIETTPFFSADGTKIYFCTSYNYPVPAEYNKRKYSLCSIDFDVVTETLSSKVDTIIDSKKWDKSIALPRPSYDGKWIVFCVSDFGTNPVNRAESDLYIMDMKNNSVRKIDEINSTDTDGYHNWSANSRWILFTSKRLDGLYANLYFTQVDDSGHFSKPFLMPQKNPRKAYCESLHSYNAPDFTSKNIDINYRNIYNGLMSEERIKISVKK